MKTILLCVPAVILGGSILGIAPRRLLAAETASASRNSLYSTSPRHSTGKAAKSGDCPISGMSLVPVYVNPGGAGTNALPATTNTHTLLITGSGGRSPGGCR